MPHARLLLVDDEVEFTLALAERLQLRKYEVKTASSALEALALIKDQLPDVVILDLKIPGMDGIETLKTIKKIDTEIEVIMLTGHGDIKSVEEGIKNGAFAYIMKPVDIEELIVKINNALAKKNKEP
jgi:DNA-binding NtrC family response regulator